MADDGVLAYSRQSIGEEDVEAVSRALRGDRITTGPLVARFEEALARRAGCTHAVVVNSGTAALNAAYFGAGLGPGDEIVTSPLTFVATASAAMHLGATVRFADVEPRTGTLDAGAARAAITSATRLIVPVDYAGHPADYDALRRVVDAHGVTLVADCAHSLGAAWRGAPAGSLAEASAFSFHPVKAITTAEGGAIVTSSAPVAERARGFRSHGVVHDRARQRDANGAGAWYYEVQHLGHNYRIPDILCALGLSQLAKLDRFVARRRTIAARYTAALNDVAGLELPWVDSRAEPAWHLYVIRVRDAGRRRAMFDALRERGLLVQVHYHPVHLHPAFQDLGYRRGLCPIAEDFGARAISIPLHPSMADSDVDRVIDTVRERARALL